MLFEQLLDQMGVRCRRCPPKRGFSGLFQQKKMGGKLILELEIWRKKCGVKKNWIPYRVLHQACVFSGQVQQVLDDGKGPMFSHTTNVQWQLIQGLGGGGNDGEKKVVKMKFWKKGRKKWTNSAFDGRVGARRDEQLHHVLFEWGRGEM